MPGCSDTSAFIDVKAYLTICLSSNPGRVYSCLWCNISCFFLICLLLWHGIVCLFSYFTKPNSFRFLSNQSPNCTCGSVDNEQTGRATPRSKYCWICPRTECVVWIKKKKIWFTGDLNLIFWCFNPCSQYVCSVMFLFSVNL